MRENHKRCVKSNNNFAIIMEQLTAVDHSNRTHPTLSNPRSSHDHSKRYSSKGKIFTGVTNTKYTLYLELINTCYIITPSVVEEFFQQTVYMLKIFV